MSDSEASSSDGEGGGGRSNYCDPGVLLPYAAELVLRGGYVSRAKAELFNKMSTAAEAIHHAYGDFRQNPQERIIPSEAAHTLAKDALAWAATMEPASDYERNLSAIAKAGFCAFQHLGLAVSIVPAFQRMQEKAARREWVKFQREASRHVGVVGEKGVFKVRLDRVIRIEGVYGGSDLHILTDESGNILKWFCSGARPEFPLDGSFVAVVGTVKAHTEREGVQETTLTRVKLHVEKPAKRSRKAA